MDFVASRAAEKQFGWKKPRQPVSANRWERRFLIPDVQAGRARFARIWTEDEKRASAIRERGPYKGEKKGAQERALVRPPFWGGRFKSIWHGGHSDFTISYCPTNIYSVGDDARVPGDEQHKPVLFGQSDRLFSPLQQLRDH